MARELLGALEIQMMLVLAQHGDDCPALEVYTRLIEASGRSYVVGGLWTILRRLEGKGYIVSRPAALMTQGGRQRLYTLSAVGRTALASSIAQLRNVVALADQLGIAA